jgi:hypothetical protein
MLAPCMGTAFRCSVASTAVELLIFGAVKGGGRRPQSPPIGAANALVGGHAAAAAYGLAHLFG